MTITRHNVFRKNFKKRVRLGSFLERKFEERLRIFVTNSSDPILKDHALTGSFAGFRAFWVTGDIRVVYFKDGDNIVLYDIGSHNQVY